MSKKKKKEMDGLRRFLITVLVVGLIGTVALLAIRWVNSSKGEDNHAGTADNGQTEGSPSNDAVSAPASFDTMALGNGINIISLSNYAGYYVEDGSDEIVSDIPVVTVENTGSDAVQYMNFSLSAADGTTYEFELTTLLPGQTMTVLEKNRAALKADAQMISAAVNNYAVFSEEPSMHTDIFQLSCIGNTLTVKNISNQTISSAKVFYKNMSGDLLIGGITYMVSGPELAPGAEVTIKPSHFADGESRILFVTYAG